MPSHWSSCRHEPLSPDRMILSIPSTRSSVERRADREKEAEGAGYCPEAWSGRSLTSQDNSCDSGSERRRDEGGGSDNDRGLPFRGHQHGGGNDERTDGHPEHAQIAGLNGAYQRRHKGPCPKQDRKRERHRVRSPFLSSLSRSAAVSVCCCGENCRAAAAPYGPSCLR